MESPVFSPSWHAESQHFESAWLQFIIFKKQKIKNRLIFFLKQIDILRKSYTY